MITEQNIEEMYNDYSYENYYKKSSHDENIEAETWNMAYEDSLFEEEN